MKRLFALLVCLALTLGLCPAALAAEEPAEDAPVTGGTVEDESAEDGTVEDTPAENGPALPHMTANVSSAGAFAAAGEVLRFRLTLSAPGSVRLQLTGAACTGQLFQLDALGGAAAVEDPVSLPGHSSKYRVPAGEYEIRLTASAAGSFSVILYHNDESAGSYEREFNNYPDHDATPLALGTSITGNAQNTIDSDYYRLRVPYRATVQLKLAVPEKSKFYVRVYSDDLRELMSFSTSEGTANTASAVTLPAGGYYVRVYPSSLLSLYSNDDYTLSVTLPSGPSGWALEEMDRAAELGLIPDRLQGSYEAAITRQEFCLLVNTMLIARSGMTLDELMAVRGVTVDPDAFVDTSDPNVLAANALGIVKGRSTVNRIFDPNSSISRQEAAVMLARTAEVLGVTEPNDTPMTFTDRISSWAEEGVSFVSGTVDPVTGKRVMQGTNTTLGTFSPGGSYTRQQSFLTMVRLYSAIGEPTWEEAPPQEDAEEPTL